MLSKHKFIDMYRPKIIIFFDDAAFSQNQSITVEEKSKPLSEMLDFFVPKYAKNGAFDDRDFKSQVTDLDVTPLKLSRVSVEPKKWGLEQTSELPLVGSLGPIPIATDLSSGKTLILDSNHTLANMISLGKFTNTTAQLKVVEIIGRDLAPAIQDFYILNR